MGDAASIRLCLALHLGVEQRGNLKPQVLRVLLQRLFARAHLQHQRLHLGVALQRPPQLSGHALAVPHRLLPLAPHVLNRRRLGLNLPNDFLQRRVELVVLQLVRV